MERAVILEGARTPIGRFLGALSEVSAVDEGVYVIQVAGDEAFEQVEGLVVAQFVDAPPDGVRVGQEDRVDAVDPRRPVGACAGDGLFHELALRMHAAVCDEDEIGTTGDGGRGPARAGRIIPQLSAQIEAPT